MATILFSSKNTASKNIAEFLMEYFEEAGEKKWRYKEHIMIDTEVENIVDFDASSFVEKERLNWKEKDEYIIVLSTHKSSAEVPALTTHCPGNWGKAMLGGKENMLSIAYGSKMLVALQEMAKKAEIEVTYEADHHGPTIDYPIMFVELGSTSMWNDKKHGKIAAKAVMNVIESKERYEAYLGFGGNHYMTKQTKLAKEKGYAFTHLLPKHNADFLNEEMFKQAIEKNVEKIEKIIMDKKGLRKEHRDFILKKANEFGLDIEKV